MNSNSTEPTPISASEMAGRLRAAGVDLNSRPAFMVLAHQDVLTDADGAWVTDPRATSAEIAALRGAPAKGQPQGEASKTSAEAVADAMDRLRNPCGYDDQASAPRAQKPCTPETVADELERLAAEGYR